MSIEHHHTLRCNLQGFCGHVQILTGLTHRREHDLLTQLTNRSVIVQLEVLHLYVNVAFDILPVISLDVLKDVRQNGIRVFSEIRAENLIDVIIRNGDVRRQNFCRIILVRSRIIRNDKNRRVQHRTAVFLSSRKDETEVVRVL